METICNTRPLRKTEIKLLLYDYYKDYGKDVYFYLIYQDVQACVFYLPNKSMKILSWYDEFGQELHSNQNKKAQHLIQQVTQQTTIAQPFTYTGYQRDGVANTYYAQAREYKPEVGRFTGEDIVKGSIVYPDTINYYSYCINAPLKYIDLDGRKIILSDQTGNQEQQLKELQKLTDHKLDFDKETGEVSIKKYNTGKEKYKKGNTLVERMINNEQVTEVVFGDVSGGWSQTRPNKENENDTKYGSNIYIQLDEDTKVPSEGKYSNKVKNRNTPLHIVLAHELIHADRMMRGLHASQSEEVEYTYYAGMWAWFKSLFPPVEWEQYSVDEKISVEELYTIGLWSGSDECITENDIRKEQGIGKRIGRNKS